MTHKEALIGKPHAPGVMKVLEGLEWVCSHYQGKGYVVTGPAIMDQYTCSLCEEGKIPYSWTPQVGEWVVYEGKVYLIYQVGEEYAPSVKANKISIADLNGYLSTSKEFLTLILEWQEIERVLEKAGYIVRVRDNEGFGEDCKYNCGIYKDKSGIGASAKSRQLAVYEAVLALGKELK